jgi:hypothetical protein
MLYVEVVPSYSENKQNTWNTLWTKRRFLIIEQLIQVLCLEEIQERGLFEVQTVINVALVQGAVYWHACRSSVIV